MAVQVFDLSELAHKCSKIMPPIDGEPYRIRLHFDADTNKAKKEKAISLLRKIGYKQVGNTSSWILRQKPSGVD